MKDFFQSWKFKVIICIFALVFGIMVYAAIAGDNIIFPRSVLETLTQPFVSAGKTVSDWATETIDTLVNANKYKEENEKLKILLTDIYGQILDKEKTDDENEQLRSILGIAENNPDYELSAPCSVIARNANDISGGFTIDKGTEDGIKLYDPVFTSIGLVGVVTSVSSYYSVVSSILSPDINVGVVTSSTKSIGIIENDITFSADGFCIMSYVAKGSDIRKGEVVTTSGSSAFPSGLMVGIVEDVFEDSNGLTMRALIKPSENIFKVTKVFVITDFNGRDNNEIQNHR